MKKILLVGGGTAGHIIPNLALIPFLEKKYKIFYVCADSNLDKNYLKNKNLTIKTLPIVKLNRRLTIKNLLLPFKLLKSIKISKAILYEIKPDVIFSKGGFVGLPITLANKKLKIPFILHESDYSMGLSNKLSQKHSNLILTTFSDTNTKYPNKTICVGSPIRKELSNKKKLIAEQNLLDHTKPTILVVGGSLGSQFFNNFFINNSIELTKRFNIILLIGRQSYPKKNTPKNFIVKSKVENIVDYYHSADIVITRGGANTLFELAFLNKLMLIIPMPTNNSRGDQIQNAQYFIKNNCGRMIKQENCNLDILLKEINYLFTHKDIFIKNLKKMNLDKNNENIIHLIEQQTNINNK